MKSKRKRKSRITRREAIVTGVTAIGALLLPGCSTPMPPTYGNILRMGDNLTYGAQRALLPGQSLAKEYSYRDITSFPAINVKNPGDSSKDYYSEEYDRHRKSGFENWGLAIEGDVAFPGELSLNALKKMPSRTQITRHTCEEGWTAIAQWTGVPLGSVLQSIGIKPNARFVTFYTYDGWIDSVDMLDAFHPQTLLTYGMNGKDLPGPHGAPVRLRVETQLGFKSLKFLKRMVVSEEFIEIGDTGWAWHGGI